MLQHGVSGFCCKHQRMLNLLEFFLTNKSNNILRNSLKAEYSAHLCQLKQILN